MSTVDTPTTQARATVRYLHRSPSKVRQVLSLVRGRPAIDAERVLELCGKEAADDVLKLLESAIANAEHLHAIPADELYVARAFCDEGPTRKWGQARARGRYFRIRHRSSHVTIVVARFDDDELDARRRRDEAEGTRGRAQRRSERVRRSRAAQAAARAEHAEHDEHDEHDHDGHDHDGAEEHEDAPAAVADDAGDEGDGDDEAEDR
jgi:large subunit ribosomal protein L22